MDTEVESPRAAAMPPRQVAMPLGVVLRRAPGATRWVRVSWRLADVIPFAPEAAGRVLRDDGAVREVHAATLPLTLHRADAEAYMQGLSARVPQAWCVLRPGREAPVPLAVTVSPFEAQDHGDGAEALVHSVPMPDALRAWVEAFAFAHHEEEGFKKRRRTPREEGAARDGIGDARVAQAADVWRSPASIRARRGAA